MTSLCGPIEHRRYSFDHLILVNLYRPGRCRLHVRIVDTWGICRRLEGLVASHPTVFDSVRGQGLMLGLKCKVPNTDVVKAGYAQHILTVAAADNVLRLLPALNIPEADIAEALRRLDAAATALEQAA